MGSFLNKILSVIGYEDKDDYYEEKSSKKKWRT